MSYFMHCSLVQEVMISGNVGGYALYMQVQIRKASAPCKANNNTQSISLHKPILFLLRFYFC
jgi:hypothetical protein